MGVVVRILGPVVIESPSAPCIALGPKPRLVLAVLAAHRGSVVSTDRLRDALWGDAQPDSALATLQSHVSRVRRHLAPHGDIVGLDRGYRLDVPDGGLDIDEFERLARLAHESTDVAEAIALHSSALACWRGPAFGDLADHEWLQAESVRLDELRLAETEEWLECRLAAGGGGSLLGDLERLTVTHPLRERFQRQLMVALYRDGRHAEALHRANEFRSLLREGMGLEPSPAFRAVENQILVDDPALRLERDTPVIPFDKLAAIDDPTRLVGREHDLARIDDALQHAHLVTLVGPGGVGKTRLARRAAATASHCGDVAFIELASVTDPGSLDDAIATALDVQPRQHLTIEDALIVALAERQQLIVFDNCEHLLDALVPLVDRLRGHCPGVRLLATSREPLGLPSEVILSVPPLAVAGEFIDDPDLIAASHAVELLVDRVAAAVPGFAVTSENASMLSEICRRLDGLPLALELVAARFRSLPPEMVLQQLGAPAGVLRGSMRSADPRHRTMRDTIGWSFAHLSAAEQTLFARLSSFAGSFDLPAVESVCMARELGPIGADGEVVDVVEVLAALVDKSMVQRVSDDGPRYQLLETLREFGHERLDESRSADLVDKVHLDWFIEFAERASVELTGSDEAEWSRRIEVDFDNLRAAFGRAVRTRNADAALRIVASLREFAFRRIRYELTTWAAACLDLPEAASHPKHPVVAAIVAYGNYVRGDLEASINVALRAIDEQNTDRDSSGLAERVLGNALGYLGRTDEALAWMDRMVVSARHGSPARLAHALYMRSVAETSVGRTVRGAILAGEAQAAAYTSASPTALAQAAYALGFALEGTEPAESLRLLRRSAQLAGAAGNRWIEAFAQTEVWWLEAHNGDVRTALTGSGHVIDTWHGGGDWANLQLSLRRVFGLFIQLGEHQTAAVLHGALNASGATTALPFEPRGAEDLTEAIVELRDALGTDRFATAVETGASLTESALVNFVQDQITALSR